MKKRAKEFCSLVFHLAPPALILVGSCIESLPSHIAEVSFFLTHCSFNESVESRTGHKEMCSDIDVVKRET